MPPPPQSDMAQAIASSKPLSDAEAASFAAALKAIDDGRYGDAGGTQRAAVIGGALTPPQQAFRAAWLGPK